DRVLIIDDCSDDGTKAISEALKRESKRVQVRRQLRRSGKNAAMRRGIVDCHSDIVIFVDGDVRLAPECLVRLVRPLLDDPLLVGTTCLNTPLQSRSWGERASRFQALLVDELRRRGNASLQRVFALRFAAIRALSLPDGVHDDI